MKKLIAIGISSLFFAGAFASNGLNKGKLVAEPMHIDLPIIMTNVEDTSCPVGTFKRTKVTNAKEINKMIYEYDNKAYTNKLSVKEQQKLSAKIEAAKKYETDCVPVDKYSSAITQEVMAMQQTYNLMKQVCAEKNSNGYRAEGCEKLRDNFNKEVANFNVT